MLALTKHKDVRLSASRLRRSFFEGSLVDPSVSDSSAGLSKETRYGWADSEPVGILSGLPVGNEFATANQYRELKIGTRRILQSVGPLSDREFSQVNPPPRSWNYGLETQTKRKFGKALELTSLPGRKSVLAAVKTASVAYSAFPDQITSSLKPTDHVYDPTTSLDHQYYPIGVTNAGSLLPHSRKIVDTRLQLLKDHTVANIDMQSLYDHATFSDPASRDSVADEIEIEIELDRDRVPGGVGAATDGIREVLVKPRFDRSQKPFADWTANEVREQPSHPT
jgi:hypothetical protein